LQLMMMPLASRHWDEGSVSETGQAGGSSDGHQNPTHAQDLALRIDENAWRPGSFMATALERLLVVASRVNTTTNYGFDDQGSTVVAGFLRQGKPQYFTRPLEAGKNYAIFAAGST